MASRLSGVFRWFSSSAPEVKPSGAEIPLAQAEEGGANGISGELLSLFLLMRSGMKLLICVQLYGYGNVF